MRDFMRQPWLCAAVLLALPGLAAAAAGDILISEVVEGSSNNKAVEIHNATGAAVDLAAGGYTLQFYFNGGTTASFNLALTGTVADGDAFVIAPSNANATILGVADQVFGASWFNGDDAIVLRKGGNAGAILDVVGQIGLDPGTQWGTDPASTADNTIRRKANVCSGDPVGSDAFDPAGEWDAFAIDTFDGLGSHANACGIAPTAPTGSGAAAPAALAAGDATLLTVAVMPGRNPDSSGLVVSADLGALGGAAAQPFFDDGSHGDALAGDLTFSYATSVAAGTGAGAITLPVAIADAQGRSGTSDIALSVIAYVAIHDLQGAGRQSPFAGAQVLTEGIVTARKSNGFFLQSDVVDANPATSEGVFVFTGAAPTVQAGDRARVGGRVVEFTSSTNPNQLSLTELSNVSVAVLESGQPLPAPVHVGAALLAAGAPVDNLEPLEGMRVALDPLVASAPGEGFIDENDATSSANGNFYGVIAGIARPFREPGIGLLDVQTLPAGFAGPRFDTNAERIRVQSTGQPGAAIIAVDTGATVTGLVGVLDYGNAAYTLLPDVDAAVTVTGGAVPVAAPARAYDEVTIGGFNLLRFYDDVNDAGGDVALTTVAFERRVRKTADAICRYVGTPDILGVVEVENLNALNRLAAAINANLPGSCAHNPQYVAYLEEGNDVGKINIGFLVSTAEVAAGVPRVAVQEVTQFGKDEVDVNPNGTTSLRNDRPPLLLRAVVAQDNGATFPVTVIGNHLRSLSGVNSMEAGSNGWSTDGHRIRAKRAAQARSLAELVEARQAADPNENLVLLGDFNAFEYNDGYVDVMGIVTGREAASGEVLVHVDSPLVRPLTNMTTLAPADDRYSFVFEGNAQTLDHIVVNQALLDAVPGAHAEHARINADFGIDNFGDDSVALRVSDHDPVVLYLSAAAFRRADLGVVVNAAAASALAGEPLAFAVQVGNTGPSVAADVLLQLRADAELPGLAVSAPAGFACAPAVIAAGTTTVDCVASRFAATANAGFTVNAPTSAAQAGRTVTLAATVDSTTDDTNAANDAGSAATALVAPRADLALAIADAPGLVVLGRDADVGLRVRNLGQDGAQSAQVGVVVIAADAEVSAQAPAGWACTKTAATRVQTTFVCRFDGRYAAGRSDRLGFRVHAERATPVAVGGAVASPTADPQAGNNRAAASFLMLALRWF